MSAPSSDPHASQVYDALLLVARVLMAYIFIKSGFGKLMDVGTFSTGLANRGVPMASALGVIGACVEFFGGVAVLVGFQTRCAAVAMLLFVIVATAISHRYWEFADAAVRRAQESNFSKNLCIMGGFVLLLATGGGRYSIDGLWRRR